MRYSDTLGVRRKLVGLLQVVLLCCAGATGTVRAQDVVMAFSQQIPPYVFPDTQNGVEVDVVREALAYRGHRLIPKFFPLENMALAFRYGRVDATMMDVGQDLTDAGGHYAKPAVAYDDVFITLQERNIRIEQPEDLTDLLVIGYIGANKRYQEWVKHPDQIGLYFERTNQEWQVLGLLRGHFDVMLTDRYIFYYYAHKLARERGVVIKPIVEHSFITLNPEHYRPVFNDPLIRDDFNAGVAHLKATGRFAEIFNTYLGTEDHTGHTPFRP